MPVSLDEIVASAEARAQKAGRAALGAAASDQLRADCLRFFDGLEEPPVYLRQEDPTRARALERLAQGELLLSRSFAANAQPMANAVRAHLQALAHVANGRLSDAEIAFWDACELEDGVIRGTRLWERSDEGPRKVYDRATGVSRYDPLPEPAVKVKLACPNASCQKVEEYAFSPRTPSHELHCPRCRAPFLGYFAEVRAAMTSKAGLKTRYRFRLQEAGGGLSRVEFDAAGPELRVARGDFLAFLYSVERELRGVVDLSSTKLVWVTRGGPCFVATAAFGEGAPELAAFRAFRDLRLRRSSVGAWAVRVYYRVGPRAGRWIERSPRARRMVRRALASIHAALKDRGYR